MLHLWTKIKINVPFILICHFTRVNSHLVVVQIHKVIPGTVAQSQSVQKAVNIKSTIHSHHVYCGSHTHPHVIAYESNSRFLLRYYNYHCVCVPPLIQTHPLKQTSNESYDSSAGVKLQRLTHSSNEYTKITVTNTHRQYVQKGHTNFISPHDLTHAVHMLDMLTSITLVILLKFTSPSLLYVFIPISSE